MAHPLACRCGTVRGLVATGGPATHVLCFCKDCQAYAHLLGRADEILDERGGSEVIMTLPKNVTFTEGADRLACVRLTRKGPFRWYASCCNTPIGNTASSHKVSFVGLLACCLDASPGALEASFGPVSMWNFTAGAKGEPKPRQTPMLKLVRRIVGMTLKARLDGSYRSTPFFDAETGKPLAEPHLLAGEGARLD